MRADTQTVTIETSPDQVLLFVADGSNLPRLAIGFARAVERNGEGWIVTTGQGGGHHDDHRGPLACTVDFRMEMGAAGDAAAFAPVLPNGAGSEFVFSQFRATRSPTTSSRPARPPSATSSRRSNAARGGMSAVDDTDLRALAAAAAAATPQRSRGRARGGT